MYKLVVANLGHEVDYSKYEKEYTTLKEVKTVVNKITNYFRRKTLDGCKIAYDNKEFKDELFNEDDILDVLHVIDDVQMNIYIVKL